MSRGIEIVDIHTKAEAMYVYVFILHLGVPLVARCSLVYRLASSPRCRGTAISILLRSPASPAIIASDAVLVLGAHDLCIPSSHAARARWIRIGCRRLRGSCVARAVCRWLRRHRPLRAGLVIGEV